MNKHAIKILYALILPVSILLVWQVLSNEGFINPQVLPAPSHVMVKWFEYFRPSKPFDGGNYLTWLFSGELPRDAFSTLYRVLVGFGIGAILGIPLGFFMGTRDNVYRLMNPLIQILRPIPPIAFIPLSILWFGLGNPPAIFLIVLGAFFPILMNTIAGVKHIDNIYIRAARNIGANERTMLLKVILPAAAPQILTGLRVGIGVAFIVVIVAEMIAVNNGLGYRILEAREYMWSDKIIAGMISIGLLGLLIDTVMDRINKYLLRWHRSLEQNER